MDVIIIGSGPAGISSALYTLRAGMKTAIIAKDDGSLGSVVEIENYYGFRTISGEKLHEIGLAQATALGARIIEDEVISITEENGSFSVITKNDTLLASAVILALGSKRIRSKITGVKEFEGRGVSYCAVCDGFFYRKKTVCVIGNSSFAAHEAEHLSNICDKLYILTNGKKLSAEMPANAEIITTEIDKIMGDNAVSGVKFMDGAEIETNGVFIAEGVASATDFAMRMGILTEGSSIITDKTQATNIKGLFAAGDCADGFKQISVAVGEGAVAGMSAASYVKKLSAAKL